MQYCRVVRVIGGVRVMSMDQYLAKAALSSDTLAGRGDCLSWQTIHFLTTVIATTLKHQPSRVINGSQLQAP